MTRSSTSARWTRQLIFAIVCVGILVWASGADAQSAADQYIPQFDKAGASDDPGGGTTASGPPTATQAGAVTDRPKLTAVEAGGSGDARGGSAPGGFPLTTFVAALSALILLALAARLLAPIISRGADAVRVR